MSARAAAALSLVGSCLLLVAPATAAPDPAAAERQYRVARRLAAEGSPQAAEALRKVVELDPRGSLADDALVEEALLHGPPRWPEDLGRIPAEPARRALELVGRVAEEFSTADRAAEARYRRALLRLEPLPSHDSAAARFDLAAVATRPDESDWSRAARYAAAWLAERTAQPERAAAAYARLLVDAPDSGAANRARVGLARLALREGDYGKAARLVQRAIEADAPPSLGAASMKELAVRLLLESAGGAAAVGAWEVVVPGTGVRNLAGLAATADGLVLADARAGRVIELGRDGAVRASWDLGEPQAVAVDPEGRIFAAAGDRLYRLTADGAPVAIAAQGDFAPVAALSVDGLGRLWIVDRRGERVGRVDPGAEAPTEVWRSREARLVALAWDGRRLIAGDSRGKTIVALDAGGARQPLALDAVLRPQSVAVDTAGRIAVLDGREDVVLLLGRDGRPLGRFDCRAAGVARPRAVALAPDGALHVFDESSGAWVRVS